MRPLRKVILHASGREGDTARSIDLRHRARGLTRIGFHYVIRRDGTLERGRELSRAGAHCLGFNADSVGVCLTGTGQVTSEQYLKLLRLLRKMLHRYPKLELLRVGELDRWIEDPLALDMHQLREATKRE